MYIPEDYQDYKYLVECHDNYFILSKQNHISGSSGDPDVISSLYQYINPPLSIEYNYYSEQSLRFSDVSSSFTDSVFERADFPLIFVCNFITCFIIAFVFNQLSKFVYKGGILGPN